MGTTRECLVVASKVKEYIKSKEMMSSSELPDAVSEAVYHILDQAVHRCKENGRKTVSAHDV